MAAVRKLVLKPEFWKKLQSYFSEENHETLMIQDNVSCVKSICGYPLLPLTHDYIHAVQLLEDEPWAVLKPILEELIADKDQDKQRGAAELLAGVLNGRTSYRDSKHTQHCRFETLANG